ncbi:MAG: sensor histidine kinase, partial [Gemmatimonadota bacterium]
GYAVDGAERMRQMINDLLAYSRVGTQGGELVPTDTDAVVDATVRDLRLAIRDRDARLTRDPLPPVRADPAQLRQLFQNLIENGLKFSGDTPPVIHLSGRREGDWCEFSVRDEGIGIDPQYFERLFVIFQRLHGREVEGTGIGLALCKRIVERHGGRIWVESEEGAGSTFTFTLPAGEGV